MIRFTVMSLALGVLLATACGSDENAGTKVGGSPTPGASKPAARSPQVFKVGDLIKVGDLVLTVTGVQAPIKSGNEFIQPAKGRFLVVSILVENHGAKAAAISSIANFELRDDGGQSYTETIVPDASKPPDGEIAPGDKLAGAVSYDVPVARHYRLYFKNAIFASGQVIIDLGQH